MNPLSADDDYHSLPSFRNIINNNENENCCIIPHRGALYQLEDHDSKNGETFQSPLYCIEIDATHNIEEVYDQTIVDSDEGDDANTHQLRYDRHDFDFAQQLFAILDTESRGLVDRNTVKQFVTLRCPVFWKRDTDLRRNTQVTVADNNSTASNPTSGSQRRYSLSRTSDSPTFDELWKSVTICSRIPYISNSITDDTLNRVQLSVEGWMVFCRFITLAQYSEAKRRFSARHLQQTMSHRNSQTNGSELVVIDVPPQEPPQSLSSYQLAMYEKKTQSSLPLPELDLDHSLVAAHEEGKYFDRESKISWKTRKQKKAFHKPLLTSGNVKISLFGTSSSLVKTKRNFSSSLLHSKSAQKFKTNPSSMEFLLSYAKHSENLLQDINASDNGTVVVRRSQEDIKWLHNTFVSHKVLGGTLCGRILPPFPGENSIIGNKSYGSKATVDASILLNNVSLKTTTNGAIAAAAAGVGLMRDVAKSLWEYAPSLTPSTSSTTTTAKTASLPPSSIPIKNNVRNNSLPNLPRSTGIHTPCADLKKKKKKLSVLAIKNSFTLPHDSSYNPNSPEGRARHIERYLNYLLQHPALSTSFPLNTILKGSQSGLESAKQILEKHHRETKQVNSSNMNLGNEGKILTSVSSTASQSSLSWVRTAAQAAMALQVHGMLETGGLKSASAKLQHASLPNYVNSSSRINASWMEDNSHSNQTATNVNIDENFGTTSGEKRLLAREVAGGKELGTLGPSFEQGVITVESELKRENTNSSTSLDEDGYDMLPLPVPTPERRILTAGSSAVIVGHSNRSLNSKERDVSLRNNVTSTSFLPPRSGNTLETQCQELRENRFHYGNNSSYNSKSNSSRDNHSKGKKSHDIAYLGEISVDEHIGKLREVIGSVDNTLSRCLVSSGGIGRGRQDNLKLHLNIVRGLDSWLGLRGKFVSQRALLKGISGIEQSKEIFEESDLAITDDVSWQACLAHSAVLAAEDVRSTVRAAKTALNAKAAASSAACAAQKICDSNAFRSTDEAWAAKTRASIAKSHAFHATVVEHEANSVKRRATLALAHDVKYWNIQRKREMLKTCLAYAKSQHEATRRAVDAWSCLRDGFIGSETVIRTVHNRNKNMHHHQYRQQLQKPGSQQQFSPSLSTCDDSSDTECPLSPSEQPEEATSTIYHDLGDQKNIIAVNHNLLTPAPLRLLEISAGNYDDTFDYQENRDYGNYDSGNKDQEYKEKISNITDESIVQINQQETILPLVEASPISNEERDISDSVVVEGIESSAINPRCAASGSSAELGFGSSDFDGEIIIGGSSHLATSSKSIGTSNELLSSPTAGLSSASTEHFIFATAVPNDDISRDNIGTVDDNRMSDSMQSLVDGLMSWGDQFDPEDDFALPLGMAASIALEESGIICNSKVYSSSDPLD